MIQLTIGEFVFLLIFAAAGALLMGREFTRYLRHNLGYRTFTPIKGDKIQLSGDLFAMFDGRRWIEGYQPQCPDEVDAPEEKGIPPPPEPPDVRQFSEWSGPPKSEQRRATRP